MAIVCASYLNFHSINIGINPIIYTEISQMSEPNITLKNTSDWH